jgi:translation elongation factor P/translation initiation factor 5A
MDEETGKGCLLVRSRIRGHAMLGVPCFFWQVKGRGVIAICAFTDDQIFTGKKLEDISPSTHNMEVPNVRRTEYQLLSIDDVSSVAFWNEPAGYLLTSQGFFNLMDGDGNAKDDVKVPDSDLGNDIQKAFDDGKDLLVTIVAAMGESRAIRGVRHSS